MDNATIPRGAFLRPELPYAALYGLAGEVTRAMAERSDADPAALLLTFLAFLGSAIGAQPHITIGGQPQPGRLFVLIVGEAATGRKGTALSQVQALFEQADPDWSASCYMFGAQSGEAIVGRVADGSDVVVVNRLVDRRLMIVEPEYGRLLERMAGSTLSPILRRAWDGSTLAIDRVRGRPSMRAYNAHVSMVGQITPAELIAHYPKLAAGNGLESRCLYAYVTKQPKKISPFLETEVPEQLAERVGAAIGQSRYRALLLTDPMSRELCMRRNLLPNDVLQFTDEVEVGWRRIEESLPEVNRDLGQMFDREFTHVMRLAILYALLDEAKMLGMEHVEAATALWTYCARSAEVIFSIPAGNSPQLIDPKRRAQVFDVLYRAYISGVKEGWMSTTDLNKAFSKNTGKGRTDIAAVADSLVADGRADVRKLGTKGRPRIEYRLIDTFTVIPSEGVSQ